MLILSIAIDGHDRIPEKSIFTHYGKQGIYTPEIPCEYIKEILVGCKLNFCETKEQIQRDLKKEFPNGEFDHIEITQSEPE